MAPARSAGPPNLLEHAPDEHGLARGVEVGRAGGGDRGAHRGVAPLGERPDGRDQHVAGLDRGEDGVAPHRVGLDGLQAAEALGELAEPALVAPGEHRAGALRGQPLSHEAPGVAGGAEDDDARGHGEGAYPRQLGWMQRLPKRQKMQRARSRGAGARKEHMPEATRVSVEVGGTEISFETGKLAKQASGSVVVSAGDTRVLSTATAGNLRDVDFLPLTVDVEERMYAAGKIPGSFFKREGRAGEKGTLVARMIDRPLRPLFPKGWRRETQLVNMPLSVDHDAPYDILAMNGASAALMVSDVPFPQPVGAVRIGKIEGNFVINPGEEAMQEAEMDLVVSGTEEAILMVECGASEVPEAEILDALDIAHGAIKQLVAAQHELREKAGKPKAEVEVPQVDEDLLYEQIKGVARRGSSTRPPRSRTSSPARTPPRPSRRPCSRSTRARDAETLRGVPPARAARLRQAREDDHPPAHRRPEEAPGRPRHRRDPRHLDRGRRAAARPRLGDLHPRPDAGPLRGLAGHHARGDARRRPRARDVQALLAPLQLPALLGGRGRLHARPQAP